MTSADDDVHVIRLRQPWKCKAVQNADHTTRLQYIRAFGCPTNLTANDRVTLVVSVEGLASVVLNGADLKIEAGAELRTDVRSSLKPRNELQLTLLTASDIDPQARVAKVRWKDDAVRLEIRTSE